MHSLQHRMIETNGVRLHIAEQGEGPLVVLLHGFPESWYSWRHQLPALAEAGFHAVAPDQRGYGDSDGPHEIEAYDQIALTSDIAGLIDALGEERAVVVGHDWGAPVAWHMALLHPERVRAVVGISVPYGGRGATSPLAVIEQMFADVFFYILYFQKPGVAEAELESDVRRSLRMFYYSASGDLDPKLVWKPHPKTAKLLETMWDTERLPPWLTEGDLDVYTSQFQKSGFRGPLNWYRNFDRTWERTPQLSEAIIGQPAHFIAGDRDPVIGFSQRQLERLPRLAPNLRGMTMLKGCGHWTQQERPQELNRELLDFLTSI